MAATKMVITITSEEGSGGRAIAQEVAKSLKLNYVDSQIIKLATKQLGISEEELADFDEKVLPKIEEIQELVTKPLDVKLSKVLAPDRDAFGLAAEPSSTIPAVTVTLSNHKKEAATRGYHALMERLIKEAAEHGNAVILRRAANFILKGRPGVVNIYIHAPLQDRIDRLSFLQNIPKTEAARLIAEKDEARKAYVREYYGADWQDPDNYHMVINTAGVPLKAVVESICDYVKAVDHNRNLSDPLDIHRSYDRLRLQESYSIKEAAEALLTDPDLLRQAVYRGEIKAAVISHNVTRISREALVEWVRRQRMN